MSAGRSMRYVLQMADRYAKASGARKKPEQIAYLRKQLEVALKPIIEDALAFKNNTSKEVAQ